MESGPVQCKGGGGKAGEAKMVQEADHEYPHLILLKLLGFILKRNKQLSTGNMTQLHFYKIMLTNLKPAFKRAVCRGNLLASSRECYF